MIKYGWMNWEKIVPYKDQLIELEQVLIKKYHYPERDIPMTYSSKSIERLKKHLDSGNTYFWGITDGELLVGYYWAYTMDFLCEKRWVLRSLMIREEYKNRGFGTLAVNEGLKKAKELECYDAVTEYAPMNDKAGKLYSKNCYEISRIEVVKKL